MTGRRTQAERRADTIDKLLTATIGSLAERGYARTTISEICGRAAVSQGGLFRHFGSRLDLMAAAADEIGRRHVAELGAAARNNGGPDRVEKWVATMRSAARSPVHAAWHEVIVAARTDVDLRPQVAESVERFERDLVAMLADTFGGSQDRGHHLATVLLSVMHMFDSEAVTRAVYSNQAIEATRVRWVRELLEREVGG